MSKKCIITDKKTLFGNKVSHSNVKTCRKFFSNLHKRVFIYNGKKIRILISKKGLKYINKFGLEYMLNYVKKKK